MALVPSPHTCDQCLEGVSGEEQALGRGLCVREQASGFGGSVPGLVVGPQRQVKHLVRGEGRGREEGREESSVRKN